MARTSLVQTTPSVGTEVPAREYTEEQQAQIKALGEVRPSTLYLPQSPTYTTCISRLHIPHICGANPSHARTHCHYQQYAHTLLLPESDPYHVWELRWLNKPDTMPRYMRAAKWKFDDAKKRIKGTMEWRREYKPDLIRPDEVCMHPPFLHTGAIIRCFGFGL